MNNPLKRTFSRTETLITLLYEIIILFLFLGAIVPHDKPLSQFFRNPLQHIQINEISIALALAIFLPAVFKHLKTLKIFGTEIELLREVKEDIRQVKRETSLRQFDHERALYTMAASLGRSLEVHSERLSRNLNEIPVEIGMMDFTESSILAEVVYRVLESNPIPVRKPERQESTLTRVHDKIMTGRKI